MSVSIVSNSSPLILYAKIGQLALLRSLFAEVVIPLAVRDEIMARGPAQLDAAEVARTPWIQSRALVSSDLLEVFLTRVDRGEAEVLALAVELGGEVPVLLDDLRARRVASERRLPVLGSAGVLVLAKERGFVSQVRPFLDELLAAGLYLDNAAYNEILAQVGE